MLIKNGYVCDPGTDLSGKRDILTENGKIKKISPVGGIDEEDAEVFDAKDLIVAPGLVDDHVHFRDPGFTHKEDIDTGAKAAARGGFTSVIMMANTKPTIDNPETLRYCLDKGRLTGINVYACANVTLGMKGTELTDMKTLKKFGAVGFTDDGIPLKDGEIVKEAMKKAKALDLPLSFHEEDPALIENNGVNRGKASEYYKIGGSPREAEISLVRRDLELALETGACIEIQHISAKETVDLIREALDKGVNVHAEVTPHHFSLTEEAVIKYGTNAKMNPPLRTEEDRLALIEGLRDGVIDIIATDHAPHAESEKDKPITEAPSGIIGLETSLALGITNLVNEGYLSMKELIKKMSTNPADLYNIDAGYIAEGGPADLCIFDPVKTWVPDEYASKSKNTPFTGSELCGKVIATVAGGVIVYSAEN
ncbi:MAG: dihydroorotase [Acetatifactor sp.]|nr:dihydroorotase [Acetatifactor sp.]